MKDSKTTKIDASWLENDAVVGINSYPYDCKLAKRLRKEEGSLFLKSKIGKIIELYFYKDRFAVQNENPLNYAIRFENISGYSCYSHELPKFIARVALLVDFWFRVSEISQISETDHDNAESVKFDCRVGRKSYSETIPYSDFDESSPEIALHNADVPSDETSDGRKGEALSWEGAYSIGKTTGGSYAGEFGDEYEHMDDLEDFEVETFIKFKAGYVPSWIFAPAFVPVLS